MWASITGLSLGWKAIALALFALAIVAGFRACTATVNHKTDVIAETAEGKGAATVALEAATKGLQNVEKGNAAAAAVDRDSDVRRAGCLRHSRTRQNC